MQAIVLPEKLDANQRKQITDAMKNIKEQTKYETQTLISFIPRTTESNYIHFVKKPKCSSDIGQQPAPQVKFSKLNIMNKMKIEKMFEKCAENWAKWAWTMGAYLGENSEKHEGIHLNTYKHKTRA